MFGCRFVNRLSVFVSSSERQKDIQDKSYEQWLASKEPPTVVETTATRRGKEDVDTTTTVPAITATARGTRTMDDIIRSITQRRQQQQSQPLHQHQRDVISNEMWLTMDNADIYRLLKTANVSGPGSTKAPS